MVQPIRVRTYLLGFLTDKDRNCRAVETVSSVNALNRTWTDV